MGRLHSLVVAGTGVVAEEDRRIDLVGVVVGSLPVVEDLVAILLAVVGAHHTGLVVVLPSHPVADRKVVDLEVGLDCIVLEEVRTLPVALHDVSRSSISCGDSTHEGEGRHSTLGRLESVDYMPCLS